MPDITYTPFYAAWHNDTDATDTPIDKDALTHFDTALAQVFAQANIGAAAAAGALYASNNLSDLANDAIARTNLGVSGGGGGLPTFTTLELHGAIGDGTTDDSVAIQAAVTAIAGTPLGGYILCDPSKTYALGAGNSGPIMWADGVHLIGGPDQARNTPGTTALGAKFVTKAAFPAGYVIDTTSTAIHNASIRGLTISAIPPTSGASTVYGGIRFQNAKYCQISGCIIYGVSMAAINVANGVKNLIRDNTVSYLTTWRQSSATPMVGNEGALTVGGTDNWIQNNQCNGGHASGDAVQFSSTFWNIGLLLNCLTSWVVGNNGEFADTGVKIVGDQNTIVGLRGDVNNGRGITFEGAVGNVCSNLLIIANSSAGSGLYDGIYLDSVSLGNSIDGISAALIATTIYMRAIVNDQANPGTAPDGLPYNPNKVKRIKAAWSMVDYDVYQCAATYQSAIDSGASFPQYRPPSRWAAGETWADTQSGTLAYSDGANWRDPSGNIVGNRLTPAQSYFQGQAVGATSVPGWTVFQSTHAVVDGHVAFGRPRALQVAPNSAGATANLCGETATSQACKPGDQFIPVMYGRVATGAAATMQLSVSWYTAALVLISTTAVTTAACPATTSAAKLVGAPVLAPAGAAFAVLNPQFTRTGGISTSDRFELSKVGLVPGNAITDHVEP